MRDPLQNKGFQYELAHGERVVRGNVACVHVEEPLCNPALTFCPQSLAKGEVDKLVGGRGVVCGSWGKLPEIVLHGLIRLCYFWGRGWGRCTPLGTRVKAVGPVWEACHNIEARVIGGPVQDA